MSDKQSDKSFKGAFSLLTVILLLLLSVGWWTGNQRAARIDTEMRDRLIHNAADVAANISPELIKKLSFTAADRGTPAFEQLREQMIRDAKMLPNVKWIYVIAERDNQIIFGPDSVPLDDPQYSPPGDAYQHPPEKLQKAFKQARLITVGPYTDEWGTFVSAFAPVLDPCNGKVMAIIGVDVKADDWQASLNSARQIPYMATLTMLLLLLFTGGIIAAYWHNQRMKPDILKLRVWITVPTAIAMIIGMILYGVYEYLEFNKNSHAIMLHTTNQARHDWNRNVASHVQLLQEQSNQIVGNQKILNAWEKHNLPELTALTQPVFQQLKQKYGITHLYFINPDRTCFLREHNSQQRDDIINCYTLLTAQRTGEGAWGINLGRMGSYTLRYVLPVKQNNKVIGYLETGIEIAHLTRQLSVEMNLDVITFISKEYMTREKFETGHQLFDFSGQWNTYPDFIVTHQTTESIPEQVTDWLKQRPGINPEDTIFNIHEDGKRFACSFISLPDAGGRKVAWLVVMLDITAEANEAWSNLLLNTGLAITLLGGVLVLLWSIAGAAERQLRTAFADLQESEMRFRNMADSAPVMIWSSGTDMGCDYFNKLWLDFTGRTFEQERGNGWSENVHPEDLQRCLDIYTTHFKNRTLFRMEYRLRRADGEYRWLLDCGSPRVDGNGNFLGYIGSCIDISEIKQAETKLLRAKEDWERTFDAVPDLIMLLDKNHRIIRVNRAMAERFGCLSGQVNCHCYKAVHGLDAPPDFCPFSKMLNTGKGEHAEVVEELLGGTFDISTTPLRDNAGEIVGCVHIAHDITKRKQVENDLRCAMNKAEAANRAKSEFMSTMSHEIRTPLNGILGFSSILTEELQKSEIDNFANFQEYLKIINQCGKTLEEIINDILEISSIEAGQFKEIDEVFAPAESISQIINTFDFKTKDKDISLTFRSHNLPDKLVGDHRRLKQIIFNIVGNAVKFTENGGVDVNVEYAENNLHIIVKDTGIGIPEDKLESVMQPFYQADQSSVRKYGGTGLGLTIVSRLLQKLGGTIDLESELNKGTSVKITFPAKLAENNLLDSERTNTKLTDSLKGLQILVVEDDQFNLMYLEKILQSSNAKYTTATSFAAMQEVCSSDLTLDVALIDISLPDSDGFECLKWLQKKFAGQKTKYIVQTAHVLSDKTTLYEEAGFDDYIGKPYTKAELVEIILKNVGK